MPDPARYDGSRPEPAYDTLLPPMRESELDELLAAEREKCAKIASDAQYEDQTGPQEAAWNSACDHIADRIRGHG